MKDSNTVTQLVNKLAYNLTTEYLKNKDLLAGLESELSHAKGKRFDFVSENASYVKGRVSGLHFALDELEVLAKAVRSFL